MKKIYITTLSLARGLHKAPYGEDMETYYRKDRKLIKEGGEFYSIEKNSSLAMKDIRIKDKSTNRKISDKRLKSILKEYEVIKLHFSVKETKVEYDVMKNNIMYMPNDIGQMFFYALLVYQHHFKFKLKNCLIGDYGEMDDFFLENSVIDYEQKNEFLILELRKR